MLCQNCGENEANVRYTQVINGVKKEMVLCEKCAHELGIGNMDFNMPISFASFLGDFFDNEKEILPSFVDNKKDSCDKCGMTYEDFINTGKFGCDNCYEIFGNKIDAVLKNIHGGNRHVGRGVSTKNVEKNIISQKKENENINNVGADALESAKDNLKQLQKDLKIAVQEERYEDAAKIRDEIKKLE